MAFNPPPYSDITGIMKSDDKHSNITLASYNGNAKPGEIVVDLITYQVYVGNSMGNLNLVGGGSGNGTVAAPVNSVQFNKDGTNFGGTSNFTWNDASNVMFVNGLFTMQGDILPSSNNAYALGSNTLQWSELHVAGNTIYLGGVPLSMGTGSNLQVDGNDVAVISASGTTNFANLEISGDIYVANVYSDGNVTSNYFIGDGSQLTNLPGGGNYGNSNVAAYLPTYDGALTANSMAIGNANAFQSFFLQVSDTSVSFGQIAAQGVSVSATNGITLAGTGGVNIQGVATSNINIGGGTGGSTVFQGPVQLGPVANVAISGGANAEVLATDGSGHLYWTTAAGTYSNANVAAYLAAFTGNVTADEMSANVANLVVVNSNTVNASTINAGTVSANYFAGDGSNLSNIPYSSIVGAYSNANVAAYLPSYTGTLNASNATLGNAVTANYFVGDGSLLSNINLANAAGGYGNSNVAAYLPTYTGNLTANNITATRTIQAGTVNAYHTGTFAAPGSNNFVLYNGAGNITGTAGLAFNAVSNTLSVANAISASSAALTTATITTLTSTTANVATVNANAVTANSLSAGTNSIAISQNTIQSANNTIYLDPLADGTFNGNVVILGGLSVTGNVTYNNIDTTVTSNLVWQAANGASTAIQATGGGLAVGPSGNSYATWLFDATGNQWRSNLPVKFTGGANVDGAITGATTVTADSFIGDGGNLSNIQYANVVGAYSNSNVANYLSNAPVTIAAVAFVGDGSNLSNIQYSSIVGAYGDSNVAAYLANSTSDISADVVTANAFVGDGGNLSNIQYSSIAGAYGDSNVESLLVGYTGVSSAGFFIGDGSNISNINYSNVTGAYGDSNVEAYLATSTANIQGDVITANSFSGDGSLLSNIQYSSLVGAYANANVADYLPGYAGDILADVSTANYFAGDGSNISNINVANITGLTTIANSVVGNASLNYDIPDIVVVNYADSNWAYGFVSDGSTQFYDQIKFFGDGTADRGFRIYDNAISQTTFQVDGTNGGSATVAGWMTAAYLVGDGHMISNIAYANVVGSYGDSNVAAYLANSTSNISGDVVTANAFIGDGAGLSNIQYSNIVGAYSNANVADYLPVNTANISGNVITGNAISLNGDLSVSGNVYVAGNVNYTDVTNLDVGDPIIFIGSNNVSDIVDLGIVGQYNNGNSNLHTGFARDHSDGIWKLFTNLVTEPTTVIDWANATPAVFSAAAFVGDGSQLSNLTYANINGAYANSNVAAYLPTYTGNLVSLAGDVTTTGNVQAAKVVNTLVVPRIDGVSTSSGILIDSATTDQYNVTALAEGVVFAVTAGIEGQKLNIRIKDNGTSQTLSWDSNFQPIGVALPATTTSSKLLYVGCIYNTQSSTWDVVSVAEQA